MSSPSFALNVFGLNDALNDWLVQPTSEPPWLIIHGAMRTAPIGELGCTAEIRHNETNRLDFDMGSSQHSDYDNIITI